MYLEIKEIGDGSVLRRKSKGQVLIFLPNSSFCRSFRSTNASDDIIFMYLDWSAIVSCAVFRNTGQRYTFILILPNFPEGKGN